MKYKTKQPQISLKAFLKANPKYNCKHSVYKLWRRTRSNGAIVYQLFCTGCGKSGGIKAKSGLAPGLMDNAPIYDPYDLGSISNFTKHDMLVAYVKYRRTENPKWWAWYNGYLKSSEWKVKSKAVRKRAKGVCEKCKKNPCEHVHHKTYQNVGNEKMCDLIAVCRKCHSELHDGKKF